MFVNFEVKKDDRDPLVQLGAWIAADYEKRALEKYPMEIPVLAITVDGDHWQLWIACSVKVPKKEQRGKTYRVQFTGPMDTGDTLSREGVFRILHVLKAVVQWGFEVYEPNYFRKVFARYKKNKK